MKLTAAPDFPAGLEWLNTDRPLSIRDLAGRIVLLDFWTFSCSTCLQVVPDIKRLQERYPEVVVIAIHSPQFETESATENIQETILRTRTEHPVVIDRDLLLWRTFGVDTWPTFVVIDPEGNVVGKTTGEGLYGRLAPRIERISREFEQRGTLRRERLTFRTASAAAREKVLFAPGKVAADRAKHRLFIADTNHHRIVVADRDGKILETIGSGEAGSADGSFEEAELYLPEGMAYDSGEGVLYLADAGNHLIRRISFADRTVETVAGTGLQAPSRSEGGEGLDVALNSPWDLTLLGDHLYIAMTGFHQIWRMDLATRRIEPYAGSGNEALIDGPPGDASFAAPTGIATDGEALYVADSSASAIRQISRGMVTTLIGHSLDDFGDLDTIARMARVHHPIGLTWEEGRIFIADTYNHKVKWLDRKTGWVMTEIGSGTRGYRDGLSGDARLNEPNGLAFMDGLWYLADTGNHAVRVYDPVGHVISTLALWR
jgi:thiol-disulfide isomerase/thioredoxin